ncbi:MAG: Trk system potassium transporter TrkA [Pseudomonadota bacterium]
MRVLICGAGRVGQGIARRLAEEKHSITIVDANPELVDIISTDLDVRGVVGHAAYPDTLRSAGVEECEMIIAVTAHDEVNMVICQIAHTLFSVGTKIARVRAQSYLKKSAGDLFSRGGLPIDVVISPEVAVGDAILQRIKSPGALTSASFARDRLKLLGFDVEPDSPFMGTALDQIDGLFPDVEARVVGIGRGDVVFSPRSNDRLQVEDRAYLAVREDEAAKLTEVFTHNNKELRHLVIVGGGNIGAYLAKKIEKETSIRVRLVEANPKRAEAAVMQLKRTIVIQGDGLDTEILEEAGIKGADFVVALTSDDKTNLLICNLAKRAGAANALALVNDVNLAALSGDLRVDMVLDPRALTVSQILQEIRRGRILKLHSIEDGKAEAVEGVVLDSSNLIGNALGYDDLPEGITAAAYVRGDEVIFPNGSTSITSDDRVILFYERHMTRKVEQYFRIRPEFF